MATTTTFNFTGAEQTWTVPSNVRQVRAELFGAGGGDVANVGTNEVSSAGQPGGKVVGDLSTTPGNTVYVYVGGQGASDGTGGFNGGGAGASANDVQSAGGGGASDVRQGGNTTSDQQAVAAGGAGGSNADGDDARDAGSAGDGGSDTGQDGGNAVTTEAEATGGAGGTQSAGGSGGSVVDGAGTAGNSGSRLNGANGVSDGGGASNSAASGGAGAGYYGGGSGATAIFTSPDSGAAGGSAGGSNYDDGMDTVDTNARGTGNAGDGQVVFTYIESPTIDSLDTSIENEVTVNWTKNDSSSTGEFEVFRSTSAGTLGTKVADALATTTTSFTDTGVNDGTQYHYTVRRIDGDAVGDSVQKSATTIAPAPTLDSLSVSGDVITANFTDNGDSEDHFEIHVRRTNTTGSSFSQSGSNIASAAGEGNSLSGDTAALLDGEKYDVKVRAVYPDTNADSSVSTATTELPDVSQPSLGNGVEDELSVSWTDVIDYKAYRVEWRETSDTTWLAALSGRQAITAADSTTNWSSGSNATLSTASNPSEDGTSVKAVTDSTGTQGNRSATFTPGSNDDLSSEDLIQFWYYTDNTAGTHSLTLKDGGGTTETVSFQSSLEQDQGQLVQVDLSSYTSVTLSNIDTYTWNFDGDGTGIDKTIYVDSIIAGIDTVDDTTTSQTIPNLEDGEEYEVRMRTETEHVNGAWTTAVSIVTKFPAVSNLAGTVQSTTQIDLTWTDNSDNEDNFIVERREVFRTGPGPWSDIATLSANTTSYSDTGLNINTTYDYKIRAETEDTTATSSTIQKTTNDDGVITDQPPAEGWFVVVEDTQGAVYRPPIVGEPALNPKLNDYSTVQVPVSRNERWEDNKWERQPMRVYHDGERQPIEEVLDIRQEPDRSVIRGVGGTELRQKVSTDIVEKDAHTTAKDLISNNTTYTANVDNPSSTTTNNVLEQSADSKPEWEGNLLNGAPAADAIYEATNGFLQSRQTAHFVEAEDADTVISDGQVIESGSSRWSGGTVESLEQVEQNNAFRKIEHTFTTDHKIPQSRAEMKVRIQVPKTGNHGFEIRVDDTIIEDIGKDTLTDNETEPDWFLGTIGSSVGDLSAGDHTLTFILQESSANDGRIYVDCMTLYDTTVSPNLTENVTDSVIDGPDLYPAANQVQTSDATTVKQVVGGKLESTWNNTLNSQEVAISNDSGGNWLTSANSETVSGSFASGSTTIRARFTISGYDTNTGASPKGRKATQTVDLYNLYANLDDTPLLANRSWDNDLKSILNGIADYGDFIWEVRYDGGFSIEWTQPGQRTNTIDPGLVDYSVTTDFSSIHRKAIIYGTHVPVTNEQFTSNHDTWVALSNDWMAETGETVTTTDGSTQFDRGSDYELKPNAGEIKVLSTGAMSDATDYEIDYFRRIRGSFTSDAHDGTYETLVESIPAITTQRNADQAALSVVKNASTPITTATVTIRKPPTGLNLVEAIDVDELPTGESLEVWSVENKPRQTILRLGSREPIEETINRIQSRLASTSKKV